MAFAQGVQAGNNLLQFKQNRQAKEREFQDEPGLANRVKEILGMELKIPELIGDKQNAEDFLELEKAVNE